MKAKRGPKKPAQDLTDEEVAETLFGKRAKNRVRKELEKTQPTENEEESDEPRPIDSEGR